MTIDEQTEKQIIEWYLKDKLTQQQIADRVGTYQVKIRRILKKHGITGMSHSDRRGLPPLSDFQKSIIIGSLLGDGYITKTGEHTGRFGVGHEFSMEQYTRWKIEQLGCFVSNTSNQRRKRFGRTILYKSLTTYTTKNSVV